MCVETVRGDTKSCSAMLGFEAPLVTRCRIWISRAEIVRPANTFFGDQEDVSAAGRDRDLVAAAGVVRPDEALRF